MAMAAVLDRFRMLTGQRILIIKPSALGDVVQTLPLLPALRRRFPQSHIAWVIQRELSELVSGHPDLDEYIPSERRPTLLQALRLARQLRRGQYDLVFDLQGLLRSALMTWATGAAVRVGLETAREGAHLAVHLTVPGTGRSVPAHARVWRVAEMLGVGDTRRQAVVQAPYTSLQQVRGWLRELPRPVFAVQWGARWETKRWPAGKLAEVLSRAALRWGGSAILVGSSGDRAAAAEMGRTVRQQAPNSAFLNLAGRTTLKELAALLSAVDAVVSNDSGPMHLAAGLGTPCLGIFTCTSSVRSGPPGLEHEFVSTTLPCRAGYHKKCPLTGANHLACHDELTVDRVWQALQRLVDRHNLAAIAVDRRAA